MAYTLYPSQPEQHAAPHFDKFQFDNGRGRFLKGSKLDFRDMERMHLTPLADLRMGRKVETPAWALSDTEFREVLVQYLEARYQIQNPTGSLKERLERCKAVGKERARRSRENLDNWADEFRAIRNERFSELSEHGYERLFCGALRGETPVRRLKRVELQISCFDGEAAMHERAAELATACAFLYYRMGFNSPSVSEELKVLTPVHVRQIICRMNRAARRRTQGSPMKLGRPRSQNPSSVSGQSPKIKAVSKEESHVESARSLETRPDFSSR